MTVPNEHDIPPEMSGEVFALESNFPGHGEKLFQFYRPLFNQRLSLRPRPAVANLQALIEHSLHGWWEGHQPLRLITADYVQRAVATSLGRELRRSALGIRVHAASADYSLELENYMLHMLSPFIKTAFLGLPKELTYYLGLNLLEMSLLGGMLTILKESEPDIRGLIELSTLGNHLVGFDQGKRPVVVIGENP